MISSKRKDLRWWNTALIVNESTHTHIYAFNSFDKQLNEFTTHVFVVEYQVLAVIKVFLTKKGTMNYTEEHSFMK